MTKKEFMEAIKDINDNDTIDITLMPEAKVKNISIKRRECIDKTFIAYICEKGKKLPVIGCSF